MKDLLNTASQQLKDTTQTYFVEIKFRDGVLGGNPKNPEVFRTHIESQLRREAKSAQKRGITPPSEERIQEIVALRMKEMFGESIEDTIDAQTEKARTGFKSNELGPYIEDRQIKACLREMMSTLGITVDKRGSKQTHQHLEAVIACDEEGNPLGGAASQHINFYRDGDVVSEVDDYVEMCAHVIGPQGPRSCIKQHDRVVGATARFLIRLPANLPKSRSTAMLRDKEISLMLSHAQNDGLGACRSQGYGKFDLVQLRRLTNVPWVRGDKRPDAGKETVAAAK
tara:strand:+ start:7305 stop:8153 length:849 start_codon:yes stop_codon:yes gene_type:complete